MIQIKKDEEKVKPPAPRELKVQLFKAMEKKKLRRKMFGLKALRMGEGFRFTPLVKEKGVDFGRGGGITEFVKGEIQTGLSHIGINGFVKANIKLNNEGRLNMRVSRFTSDSLLLKKHVIDFLKDKEKLNRPFWKNLGASSRLLIKFFFLESINTRDLASDFARQSFVSDDGLVIFIYKDVKSYNYGNSINLLELI